MKPSVERNGNLFIYWKYIRDRNRESSKGLLVKKFEINKKNIQGTQEATERTKKLRQKLCSKTYQE